MVRDLNYITSYDLRDVTEALAATFARGLVLMSGIDDLHLTGEPTKAYLGMITAYALQKAYFMSENEKEKALCREAMERFDPTNMSENLIAFLKDLLAYRIRVEKEADHGFNPGHT